MFRFDRDHVIKKNDPEQYFANQDLAYLMRAVNLPPKKIILNGKHTLSSFYFGVLADRFDDEQSFFEMEYNLSKTIKAIKLHHGNIVISKTKTARESLQDILKIDKSTKSLDILHEIIETVHPAFWSSLISRWGWHNDDVNSSWIKKDNQLYLKIYNNDNDANNNNYTTTMISKFRVDKNLIETILKLLRYSETEMPNFGYQSIKHWKAIKSNWFAYWSSTHYVSFKYRQENDKGFCVLNWDLPSFISRKKLCLKNDRLKWEWNNSLFNTKTTGTIVNEFTHFRANSEGIHTSTRSLNLTIVQHAAFFINFNEAHFLYLFENNKEMNWPNSLKREFQAIYTEANLMYHYMLEHSKPRQKLFNIQKQIDIAKQLMNSLIIKHKMPSKPNHWHKNAARNHQVLVLWILLIGIRLKNFKIKQPSNNQRTHNFNKYEEYEWDSNIDSDDDLEQYQKDAEYEAYCILQNKFNKKYKRYLSQKHQYFTPELNCIEKKTNKHQIKQSLKKKIKNLSKQDLHYFEFEPIPYHLVQKCAKQVFCERFSTKVICRQLHLAGFQVTAYVPFIS